MQRKRGKQQNWKDYRSLSEMILMVWLDNHDDVITHLVRQPGVRSQVGLRKEFYEQNWLR